MKRFLTTFLLILSIISLYYAITSYRHEKALLQATETLIDRVYTDNENYFLDVLSESDEYQDYLEIL